MLRMTRRVFVAAAACGLAFASPAVAQTAKLPVVASFSILGDFVAKVGGERVQITTLVGPNGDAHVYEPTPADAKAVAGARIVFVNGLGFEGWMTKLAKAAGTKAPIVAATKGITPREMAEEHEEHGKAGHDHGHGHGHGHDHGAADPHAWQSVGNVATYVANVRDALVAADPEGKAVYEANASAYLGEIAALDAEVKAAIAAIPAAKRRVITSHDAFGYFAAAYGIEFLAPQGMSTEGEATPKQVAALIKQIRKEKITAVFIENMSDRRLVERIAKETGVKLGGELFADALSPKGGPAPTYVDMVRTNVKLLTAAMAGA